MTVRAAERQSLEAAEEEEEDEEYCFINTIEVSSSNASDFTELVVETMEYPGLMRVISWVLNGLGLRAENAVLKTEEDGTAKHRYWVQPLAGGKLSDKDADDLKERLQTFIRTCKPPARSNLMQEYRWDDVTISNIAHPKYTRVVIEGEPGGKRPGFLLELASVLTGVGLIIHEGIIQGSAEGVGAPLMPPPEFDYRKGRLFTFFVTTSTKEKLDYSRALSLIYTLGLVFGSSNGPTVPPGQDLLPVTSWALTSTDGE